jgi:hypothetical protein
MHATHPATNMLAISLLEDNRRADVHAGCSDPLVEPAPLVRAINAIIRKILDEHRDRDSLRRFCRRLE